MMKRADLGDSVKIHYTGKLDNGLVFDCTKERGPFELKIGSGMAVPGFEMGMTGMAEGDKRTIKVSPEDGFGLRDEKLKDKVNRNDLPDNIILEIGKQLMIPHPDGDFIRATVIEIERDTVVFDINHPLAGKTLVFEVEMLDISKNDGSCHLSEK
ncbi:MAG: peptidylprolyl isomerase [candidate division Zixibacteria bacterium]|nr:peptidylprolyl isomerase [candidate division Zixibacteria bacterium]